MFSTKTRKVGGLNIWLVSLRDILLQKRVSLTHTPDIVRVFQKETQAQEQHEFQKVKDIYFFKKNPRDFFWPFAIYTFTLNWLLI